MTARTLRRGRAELQRLIAAADFEEATEVHAAFKKATSAAHRLCEC